MITFIIIISIIIIIFPQLNKVFGSGWTCTQRDKSRRPLCLERWKSSLGSSNTNEKDWSPYSVRHVSRKISKNSCIDIDATNSPPLVASAPPFPVSLPPILSIQANNNNFTTTPQISYPKKLWWWLQEQSRDTEFEEEGNKKRGRKCAATATASVGRWGGFSACPSPSSRSSSPSSASSSGSSGKISHLTSYHLQRNSECRRS